jgi:hypothetical protein
MYRHTGVQSGRFDLKVDPLPNHTGFVFIKNAQKIQLLSVI